MGLYSERCTKLEHERVFFFKFFLFWLRSPELNFVFGYFSLQFLAKFSFTTEHKIEFWNNYSLDGHIGIVRWNRTFPFNAVYYGKRQTTTIFVARNSITELCWTKFITKVTKLKGQCNKQASKRTGNGTRFHQFYLKKFLWNSRSLDALTLYIIA